MLKRFWRRFRRVFDIRVGDVSGTGWAASSAPPARQDDPPERRRGNF